MASVFKLFGELALETDGAIKNLDNAVSQAQKSESKFSNAFAKIGAAVAGAFTVKKIADFGLKCIAAASDVEEMQNKFNVVFQGMTDEVNQWADNFASAIGRNANVIKGYLADNQNMFVGMGMTRDAGAKLSEQMVELALDLASFNNLEETESVNALSKALMGETESAKRLGAVLNENTIAMAMETLGYKQKFDTLTEAEKMEVRYQAILMQSADAIGDCARSVDSFKGSQIRLKSATQNLMETIGAKLLPIATRVVSVFADGAAFITSNIDDVIFAVEALATVFAVNLAANGIGAAISAFGAAQVQLALLTMESGSAAVAQAALSGSLSFTEIAVGILTGQISLATAAQAAFNAVILANPIALFGTAVAGLAIYANKVVKSQKEMAASEVGVANSSEEAAAKVEEYKNKIAELKAEMEEGIITDPDAYVQQQNALDKLTYQLSIAEDQWNSFKEAEEAAATAAEDPAERFKAATEEYTNAATELMQKAQAAYESVYNKVSSYFGAFDKVKIDVKTSTQEIMEAMQSQIDFNNQYTENLQYLKDNGLGALSESLQSYGAEGSAYAAAIVASLKDLGGASTEQGQAFVENMTGMLKGVEESQGELANTLTLMNGEIESQIQELTDSYTQSIADLDKSEEALQNAQNTMSSFEAGISSGIPGILSQMSSLGSQMTSALQASLGSVRVTVNADLNAPKLAVGLDYVPYDEFPAVLHRGEAVLTASEAAAWRSGKRAASSTVAVESESDSGSSGASGGLTVNQYIQAVAQTPVELAAATESYFYQARWAV